jgi:ketosteroid isomerase-like protein
MRNSLLTFALLLLASLSVVAQKDMKTDIMAANQKFMDAFQKGATAMGSMYTTDAQLFPPNSDVVRGTSAITTFWKGGYDMGIKKAKLETVEAEQNGNLVTEVGNYTLYGANDAQMDAGKYIVVWKKEGGQWKLHRDIWNTNTPASVAAK